MKALRFEILRKVQDRKTENEIPWKKINFFGRKNKKNLILLMSSKWITD